MNGIQLEIPRPKLYEIRRSYRPGRYRTKASVEGKVQRVNCFQGPLRGPYLQGAMLTLQQHFELW